MVAARVILGERVAERAPPGPAIVQRRGQGLCIDERVADPLRRNRILVVSRVPDERPTRTERLTEIVGNAGRPEPLLFARRALSSRVSSIAVGRPRSVWTRAPF